MAIYSRDNFAPALQSALDSALRRRDEYVKRDAARRDANVKAITDMMKVAGRAAESTSEQEDKLKKLEEERNAILKAQEEANAARLAKANAMEDATAYTTVGKRLTSDLGPSLSQVQAEAMRGYKPNQDYKTAFYMTRSPVSFQSPYYMPADEHQGSTDAPLSAMRGYRPILSGADYTAAMQANYRGNRTVAPRNPEPYLGVMRIPLWNPDDENGGVY